MKWFSLSAVIKEIKKIRWQNKSDLVNNSIQVIFFTFAFGLFFFLCQLVISQLLRLLGALA